jgi:DNA mismatch endonuclease, patch repair protein
MTDNLDAGQRSERMRRIKAKHSKPEMLVRRIVRGLGFRYSLHVGGLPGTPDIVFRKYNRVIFVHGCFWHRHLSSRCHLARLPKSNVEFWIPKLESNRLRDQRNQRNLRKLGWKILVVWECQLRHKEQLKNRIRRFLEAENAGS